MSVPTPEELAITLTQEMIRTPTVNPPGSERHLAERLCTVMTEGGLTCALYPLSPERASVVGRIRGKGTRPALAMAGHIDTVAPGELAWSHDPFAGDLVNGRLRGRGASDMNRGVAVTIATALALVNSQVELQGDLIIACTGLVRR